MTKQLLIVADEADCLAREIRRLFAQDSTQIRQVAPQHCGDLVLTLSPNGLKVDGQVIGGLLLRCQSDWQFGAGFRVEDQQFCNSELSAVLLAAVNLHGLFTINSHNAVTWFDGLRWPAFRTLLTMAGIPVSPLHVGESSLESGHWIPFRGRALFPLPSTVARTRLCLAALPLIPLRRAYWVFGEWHGTNCAPIPCHFKQAMEIAGLNLAEVTYDSEDRILLIDPVPHPGTKEMTKVIATRICERYYAHWHHRRAG